MTALGGPPTPPDGPPPAAVLEAAERLLDDHCAAPDLPVELAVHAAAVLAGEVPRYRELGWTDRPATLVFTLVTGTRILRLTAPGGAPADGGDIGTEVWELADLRQVRLVSPLPGASPAGAPDDPLAPGHSWLLGFDDRPPLRLPVAGSPSSGLRRAAAALAASLRPADHADPPEPPGP